MRILAILFAPALVTLTGCALATGSAERGAHVRRPATSPQSVKIYTTRPAGCVEVGVVKAESEIAPTPYGGAMHYASRELRRQAARIGANGLVDVEAVSGYRFDAQPVIYDERIGTTHAGPLAAPPNGFVTRMDRVNVKAVAVWVPPEATVDGPTVLAELPAGRAGWSEPGATGTMTLRAGK